jgi:hypothetical protein
LVIDNESVLQWVSTHCRIAGNRNTDFVAQRRGYLKDQGRKYCATYTTNIIKNRDSITPLSSLANSSVNVSDSSVLKSHIIERNSSPVILICCFGLLTEHFIMKNLKRKVQQYYKQEELSQESQRKSLLLQLMS